MIAEEIRFNQTLSYLIPLGEGGVAGSSEQADASPLWESPACVSPGACQLPASEGRSGFFFFFFFNQSSTTAIRKVRLVDFGFLEEVGARNI